MAEHDDILTLTKQIHEKNAELEKKREMIYNASKQRAKAISDHKKARALTVLKLKHGQIKEFEGVPIPSSLPATLINNIAEGICFKELLLREEKDGGYKGLIAVCDCIKAELNGLQSIISKLT